MFICQANLVFLGGVAQRDRLQDAERFYNSLGLLFGLGVRHRRFLLESVVLLTLNNVYPLLTSSPTDRKAIYMMS